MDPTPVSAHGPLVPREVQQLLLFLVCAFNSTGTSVIGFPPCPSSSAVAAPHRRSLVYTAVAGELRAQGAHGQLSPLWSLRQVTQLSSAGPVRCSGDNLGGVSKGTSETPPP